MSKARFSTGADGWLVACARVHGDIVVTNEQPAPDAKKGIKLPDVYDKSMWSARPPFRCSGQRESAPPGQEADDALWPSEAAFETAIEAYLLARTTMITASAKPGNHRAILLTRMRATTTRPSNMRPTPVSTRHDGATQM